ncbi:unnamed protein product [Closterium sp. Naga37s-1]|nr:unnamed protein product [Closterium sp. Naga37s-1]
MFTRRLGRGGGAGGRGGRGRGGRVRRSARVCVEGVPAEASAEVLAGVLRRAVGDAVGRVTIKGCTRVGDVVGGARQQWASLGVAYADLLSPEAADSLLRCERAGAPLHVGGRMLGVQRVAEHRRAPEGLLHRATVHVGFIQRPGQLAVTWQSEVAECRVEFDFLERRVRVLVGEGRTGRGRDSDDGGEAWQHSAGGRGAAAASSPEGMAGSCQRLQHRLDWRMRDVRLWGAPHRRRDRATPSERRPPLLLLPAVPPAVFTRACDDDVWQRDPCAWLPDDSDPWTRSTDLRLAPAAPRTGAVGTVGGEGWGGGVLGVGSLVVQVSMGRESSGKVKEIAGRMRTVGLWCRSRYLGPPHHSITTSFFRPHPPITIAPFVCLPPRWPSTGRATTTTVTGSSGGRGGAQATELAFPVLYVLTLLVQRGTIPLTAVTAPLYRTLAREAPRAAVAVLLEFMCYARPEFDPSGQFTRIARAMRHQGKLPWRRERLEGGGGQAGGGAAEGTRSRRRGEVVQQQGTAEEHEERRGGEEEETGQEKKAGREAEGAVEQSEGSAWPWVLPENHVLVFHLLVTPLAAQCCLPSVELANRVIAHYRPHAHRFLRVTFTEEGERQLASFALVGGAYRAEEAHHSARTDVYHHILKLVNQVGGEWGMEQGEGVSTCGGCRCGVAASQLREKSAWFLAEDATHGLTVAAVQAWMGTFTAIRNVAKCAARMGQCFSSRFTLLPLPRVQVRNPGRRSLLPLTVLTCLWGGARGGGCVRRRRFRSGTQGVKGMVAVWPRGVMQRVEAQGAAGPAEHATGAWQQQQKQEEAVDLWFQEGQCAGAWWAQARQAGGEAGRAAAGGVHVWVRDSMDKFESQHADVELVNWTRPQPCYLNRQIVTLLSTLGVPDRVFLDMQVRCASTAPLLSLALRLASCVHHPPIPAPCSNRKRAVFPLFPAPPPPAPHPLALRLEAAVGSGAAALQLLEESGADHLHGTAITMLRVGFHPAHEPHLKRIIQAVRAVQLQGLISRARIFVKDGRWLMGVVDETGLLQYGQCFIQVCDATAPAPSATATLRLHSTGRGMGAPRVVTGPVMFGKNPCLHPGDLRVLTAVDVPCLHHLIDCLVLPKHGPRPHANEASGSDMDGDVYFVTWDKRLLPPRGSSEPMDYQPAKQDSHAPVTMQDVHRFFVDHMLNDSVGIICNAHVVHADQSPDGAFDDNCLTLARQAALAFDFPKTGVPGALGQLYRRVLGQQPCDRARVVPGVEEDEEEGGQGDEGSDEEGDAEVQQGAGGESGDRGWGGRGWEGEADVMADRRTWLRYPGADEVGQAYRADLRAEGFEQHVEEARWLKQEYDRSSCTRCAHAHPAPGAPMHILHQVRPCTSCTRCAHAHPAPGAPMRILHQVRPCTSCTRCAHAHPAPGAPMHILHQVRPCTSCTRCAHAHPAPGAPMHILHQVRPCTSCTRCAHAHPAPGAPMHILHQVRPCTSCTRCAHAHPAPGAPMHILHQVRPCTSCTRCAHAHPAPGAPMHILHQVRPCTSCTRCAHAHPAPGAPMHILHQVRPCTSCTRCAHAHPAPGAPMHILHQVRPCTSCTRCAHAHPAPGAPMHILHQVRPCTSCTRCAHAHPAPGAPMHILHQVRPCTSCTRCAHAHPAPGAPLHILHQVRHCTSCTRCAIAHPAPGAPLHILHQVRHCTSCTRCAIAHPAPGAPLHILHQVRHCTSCTRCAIAHPAPGAPLHILHQVRHCTSCTRCAIAHPAPGAPLHILHQVRHCTSCTRCAIAHPAPGAPLHILHQFGIMSEAEVVLGSLLHAAHHHGRREEAVREHVRNMFLSLRHRYHRLLVYGVDAEGEDGEERGERDGGERGGGGTGRSALMIHSGIRASLGSTAGASSSPWHRRLVGLLMRIAHVLSSMCAWVSMRCTAALISHVRSREVAQ